MYDLHNFTIFKAQSFEMDHYWKGGCWMQPYVLTQIHISIEPAECLD